MASTASSGSSGTSAAWGPAPGSPSRWPAGSASGRSDLSIPHKRPDHVMLDETATQDAHLCVQHTVSHCET
eukprot:4065105-Lingulodinium_polyedra.AAC.1